MVIITRYSLVTICTLFFLTVTYQINKNYGYLGGGFLLSAAEFLFYFLAAFKVFKLFSRTDQPSKRKGLFFLTLFTVFIGTGDIGWHTLHYIPFLKEYDGQINIVMNCLFILGYITGGISTHLLTDYDPKRPLVKSLTLFLPMILALLAFKYFFLPSAPTHENKEFIHWLTEAHVLFSAYAFFVFLIGLLSSRKIISSFYFGGISLMFLNGTQVVALSYTGVPFELNIAEFVWAFGVFISTYSLFKMDEVKTFESFEPRSILTQIRLFSLLSTTSIIGLVLFSIEILDPLAIIKFSAIGMTLGVWVAIFFSHMLYSKISNYREGMAEVFEKGLISQVDYDKTKASMPFELQCSYDSALQDKLNTLNEKLQVEKSEALSQMAKKVAHDIRSPLAALEMVSSNIQGLPEESRNILRTICQRISDIANNLLRDHRDINKNTKAKVQSCLVVPLIEQILSEKRLTLKNRNHCLEADLPSHLALATSKINKVEFSRLLSNILNNSLEALGDSGKVVIKLLQERPGLFTLRIQDDGKGIPKMVLDRLGKEVITSGKEEGNGLGLFNAAKEMEKMGGELIVKSILNEGTTVSLMIPECDPPNWLVKDIQVRNNQTLILVDDDPSIHNLWKEKYKNRDFSSLHFNSLFSFEAWLNEVKPDYEDFVFLVDHDFTGEKRKGLEMMLQNGLEGRGHLMTSHFQDDSIVVKCIEEKIKILPKYLLSKTIVTQVPSFTSVSQKDCHGLIDRTH